MTTKDLEGTITVLLSTQREPFLLLLLGILLLCVAAGLERNRLSWMSSKFLEQSFEAQQFVLLKRVARTINHYRGHNGKYQTTQNH